jgi:hypothetical protein
MNNSNYQKNSRLFSILLVIAMMFIYSPISASTAYQVKQTQDSTIQTLNHQLNYNSDYLQKAEVEHQILLRNIFAVGFFFMLVMLIFTLYFYASKIKKVTDILILQDDALKSTKDQLIKIINIFNYVDQQIYITDSKGIIEWANTYASNYFTEKYEENQISLVQKFTTENQGIVFKGINDQLQVTFKDNLYKEQAQWKMIPIKNSKGEFSNMVFIS